MRASWIQLLRTVVPRLIMVPAILLLGACAATPVTQDSAGQRQISQNQADQTNESGRLTPNESFTPALLYQLLLGEIAGQRSQMGAALSSYLAAAEATEDPRVAERALRMAAYAKNEAQALQAARRWVELDPSNPSALQSLGVLELRIGNEEQGAEILERLISSSPDTADGYERVVASLSRVPDKDLVLRVAEQITKAHPKEAQAHYARSRLAASAESYEQALRSVRRALELSGYWAQAEVFQAEVLVELNRESEAAKSLYRVLQKHSEDVNLRLAYARLLVDAGRLKEANQQFKRIEKQQPDNTTVILSLALLALETKEVEEAEGYLLRLTKKGEHLDEANYYLGRIAEQRGQSKQAIQWYSKVTKGSHWLDAQVHSALMRASNGDSPGARVALQNLRNTYPQFTVRSVLTEGAILMDEGAYETAFDLYSKHIERQPDNTEYRYARALAAEKLDRLELAETDLRRILEKDPDNVAALNALGYTLADRTNRLEEAEKYISRAISLNPDDPAIIDSMGWLQYRLGNYEAAVTHLRRAYGLSGDGEIGAHLGEALWKMGEQVQARKIWEEARLEDPTNPVLMEVIKRYLP